MNVPFVVPPTTPKEAEVVCDAMRCAEDRGLIECARDDVVVGREMVRWLEERWCEVVGGEMV